MHLPRFTRVRSLNYMLGVLALSFAGAQVPIYAANVAERMPADQWHAYGHDYSEQRFSPLDTVNVDTVTRLGLHRSNARLRDCVRRAHRQADLAVKDLWKFNTGRPIAASPISYAVADRAPARGPACKPRPLGSSENAIQEIS